MAGVWRLMIGVPPFLWEKQIKRAKYKVNKSTRFMSREHRLVHHFVVREMPRVGGPISAEIPGIGYTFGAHQGTITGVGRAPDLPG